MSKRYDLLNKRFGKLTVIENLGLSVNNSGKKMVLWKCKCDCGEIITTNTNYLNSGHTKQCLKCAHMNTGVSKREDLTGIKFGKLTVNKMLYNYNGTNRTKCLCHCDCGNDNIIREAYSLKNAKDSSCGCGRKEYIQKAVGINIDGRKFGKLTILETLWDENPPKVKCKCDCGNVGIYRKSDVQSGHTRSCGCLLIESISKCNQVDHSNKMSDYGIKILSQAEQNSKGQWLWYCECGLCKNIFKELPARILNNHIRSCGCLKSSSKEIFIENILKELSVDYIPQYSFPDCKSKNNYVLRFDFALIKNGEVFYLIEYDGEQHFRPVEIFGGEIGYEETVNRDNIKNKYCKNNNINLLRLSYTLTEQEIKDKITNIIYP